jgi:hypothetical protein
MAMTATPPTLSDPIDPLTLSRARFASFPDPLKQALRIAAKRHGWGEGEWAYQTDMLSRSMRDGSATAEELAAAYLEDPVDREGLA